MNIVDYHMHSTYSKDSSAAMDDICEMAIRQGLRGICFTEHVDFDPSEFCYGYFDYGACTRGVEQCRAKYGDRLVIGQGIEITYQTEFEQEIRQFLQSHQFDFVLGSVHLINHVFVGREEYFTGKTEDEAYGLYWDETLAMVNSGLVSRIGHFDYLKQARPREWGPFDIEPWRERIAGMLSAAVKRGMTIEVNTSAIRKGLGEPFPSWDILRIYREVGGRMVTLGSDSHRACDIGADFESVREGLAKLGIAVAGTEILDLAR